MMLKDLIDQWLQRQLVRVSLGKLKPASLVAFTVQANHIRLGLGDLELEAVKNGVVKQFTESLVAAGKAPKTIKEILATLKMILRSHRDENGERLLDLSKWDFGFITENVPVSKPKQPSVSKEVLNVVLKDHKLPVRSRVLIALGASTGLRIGELLAIKIHGGEQDSSWDGDCIHVRKSLWRGQLQLPKTASALRIVDISTRVQSMLQKFAEDREPGSFLFVTIAGKPLSPKYVLEDVMKPASIPGAHSLRRYRVTWLEEQGCPRGLEAYWIGHSLLDVSARYDKTAEDLEFRRKQVERIGTGLDLMDAVAPQISKPVVKPAVVKIKRDPRRASMIVKHTLVHRKPRQFAKMRRPNLIAVVTPAKEK